MRCWPSPRVQAVGAGEIGGLPEREVHTMRANVVRWVPRLLLSVAASLVVPIGMPYGQEASHIEESDLPEQPVATEACDDGHGGV
jgi:hypothetical protein